MKNLNKTLITLLALPCLIFGLAFAEIEDSDCWKFGILSYQQSDNGFDIINNSRETNNNKYTDFLTIDQQRAIITKNDLSTALLNLKKYCCEKQLWWLKQSSNACKNDKNFFNDNAPDSPYLFDHLFDVIMRRLNWLSGDNNIYTKTQMTLDDKWVEWRDWISEKAGSTEWYIPEAINSKYNKIRNQSSPDLWFNITTQIYSTFWNLDDQSFLLYVSGKGWSDESKKIATAFQKYNERTLYDRYKNACALSEYFYSLLNLWVNSNNDKMQIIKKVAENSCDTIIDRQIESENSYVQVITKKTSSLFLSNYLEWYLTYLYNRQDKLEKLWTDTKNRRFDVTRAVPCLQSKCVQ